MRQPPIVMAYLHDLYVASTDPIELDMMHYFKTLPSLSTQPNVRPLTRQIGKKGD